MSESQIGGIIEIPVCREAGLVRTKLGFCLTNSLTWIFVSSIWEVSEIVVNSALRQIQISSLITSKTSRDVTFYFSLGSFFSPQKKSIDWQRRRKFFFIIISHLDENHKLINRFVRLVLCGNFSHVLSLLPLSPSFLIKYFAPGEYWVLSTEYTLHTERGTILCSVECCSDLQVTTTYHQDWNKEKWRITHEYKLLKYKVLFPHYRSISWLLVLESVKL